MSTDDGSVASKNDIDMSKLSLAGDRPSAVARKNGDHPNGGGGSDKWVRLNVGGTLFTTTRSTLSNDPESFLYCLCKDNGLESQKDASGAYLIDRDPHYFRLILNYLRHGKLVVDSHLSEEGMLEEAEFYNVTNLIHLLHEKLNKKKLQQQASNKWVQLNVGGTLFTMTRRTLEDPKSFLYDICKDNGLDASGAYQIDRDPHYFGPILNYLRHGKLVLDRHLAEEGVLEEAEFYGVTNLIRLLKKKIREKGDEKQSEASHHKDLLDEVRSLGDQLGRPHRDLLHQVRSLGELLRRHFHG